jgi:hypothetical protein
MWQNLILLTWGCIPELTKNCQDMTNASSTYLGIVIGAVIGGILAGGSTIDRTKHRKSTTLCSSILKNLMNIMNIF